MACCEIQCVIYTECRQKSKRNFKFRIVNSDNRQHGWRTHFLSITKKKIFNNSGNNGHRLKSVTCKQILIDVYCYSYLSLTWGTCVTTCHHRPPLRQSYRFTFIVTVTWASLGAPVRLPVITDHLSDDPTDSYLLLQLLEPHLGHLCDYLSSPTTSQTILQIHVYCYSYLSLTWGTCVTTCHPRPPLRQSYRFTFIVTVTWASPGAPVWLPVIPDHLSDDPTDSRLLLQLLEPHLGHLCDYLSSPTTSQTILQIDVYCYSYLSLTWGTCATTCHPRPPLRRSYRFIFVVTVTWASPGAPVWLPVIPDHLSDDPTDWRLLLQLLEPHLGHLCDYLSSPTTSQTILQIDVYCYSYLSLTWGTCVTTCHHRPPLRRSYRFMFIVSVTWASPGAPVWLPVIPDHLSDDPTDSRLLLQLLEPHLGHLCDYLSSPTTSQTILQIDVYCYSYLSLTWGTCVTTCHPRPPLRRSYRFIFVVTVTWASPGAPVWLPVIPDHLSDDPTNSRLLLQLLEPHLGHLCDYLSSPTTSQTILQIHVYCYSYLSLTWGTCVTTCHHRPPLRRSYRLTFIVTVTWASLGTPVWLPVITDHLSDNPTDSRLLLQLLEPHLGHLCDYLSSPTTSQTILQIDVYCYSYLSLTWGTCVTTCHHRPPLRRSYRFMFIVSVTWASPGAPVWLPVIPDHLSDDPTDSRLLLQLLEPHLGHLCDYLSSPTTSQTILQIDVYCYSYLSLTWGTCVTTCHPRSPLRRSYRFIFVVTVTWASPGAPVWLPVIPDHLSDDPTNSRLLLQLLEPHLGHLCDYLSSPTTSQTILQIHVYCYSYLSLTWGTCVTTCHPRPPLRRSYRFTFIVTVTWASLGTPVWLPVITNHLSDNPTDSYLLLQLLEPHLGHLCDYLSSPTTSQTILQIHVCCYSYLSLTWGTCATTCHHRPPLRRSYRFTFIVTVTWASPGTPVRLPVITDHLSDDPTDSRLLLQLLEPHLGHLCDYLSSPTTSQTILQIHVYCYSYLSLTWGTCVTTCHPRPPLRRSYRFTFIVTVTWASPGTPVWLPVITDHLSDNLADVRRHGADQSARLRPSPQQTEAFLWTNPGQSHPRCEDYRSCRQNQQGILFYLTRDNPFEIHGECINNSISCGTRVAICRVVTSTPRLLICMKPLRSQSQGHGCPLRMDSWKWRWRPYVASPHYITPCSLRAELVYC